MTKIRESARGENCTMFSPMCNSNPETVVWCHSNHSEHGKGVGKKAEDWAGFYGCSGCHSWYDTESKRLGVPNYVRREYFYRAFSRSFPKLIEKGLVVIK